MRADYTYDGGMTPAEEIAAAFGALLLRGNRAHLYDRLTEDVAGVDSTTYPVLSGLDRAGSATATRLAEIIGLDRTVTTRYAARLAELGLVARTADPHDARAVHLTLTVQGRAAVATMRAALVSTLAVATAGWPADELESFAVSLRRLVDALLPG